MTKQECVAFSTELQKKLTGEQKALDIIPGAEECPEDDMSREEMIERIDEAITSILDAPINMLPVIAELAEELNHVVEKIVASRRGTIDNACESSEVYSECKTSRGKECMGCVSDAKAPGSGTFLCNKKTRKDDCECQGPEITAKFCPACKPWCKKKNAHKLRPDHRRCKLAACAACEECQVEKANETILLTF